MNFANFLTENQLTVIDNDASNSLRSFIQVFTAALQVDETHLLREIEIFFCSSECRNALELEYGPHARIIGSFTSLIGGNFCPVLAMVCAVSWAYHRKVIIANDYKNLAFLTRGDSFCLIKPLVIEGEAILVALTDMAHFKTLTVANLDQIRRIENSIGQEATIFLPELDTATPTDQPDLPNGPDFAPESENEGSEPEIGPERVTDINHMTMHQYLGMNFFDPNGAGLVDPYTNGCIIDAINSDVHVLEPDCTVTFRKSLDLDGVFALVDPDDFCNVVVTGGKIKKPVYCKAPKTLFSIKKHMFDIGVEERQEITAIEFGDLHVGQVGNNFKLFAVASWNQELRIDPSSIELDKIFIKAHNAAKRFQCSNYNCPFKDEHLGLTSRPDDVTQIEVADFSWVYPPASFKCIARDLASSMMEDINRIVGVNLYFYIMLIGSKFTLLVQNVHSFGTLLDKVAEVINLNHLARIQPPRAFVDVCWKYSTAENEVTIIICTILLIYFCF